MNTIDDIKYTVIFDCVESDLLSIKQGNYDKIIAKMNSLPPRKLESVLEVLNMHVLYNMCPDKKTSKKQHNTNTFHVI